MPAFKVVKTTNQNINANTFTPITFNETSYKTGSGTITSNSRFTCAERGIYSFNGRVAVNTPSARAFAFLIINGTQSDRGQDVQTSQLGQLIATDMLLEVGDIVELGIWCSASAVAEGNTLSTSGRTVFSGELTRRLPA